MESTYGDRNHTEVWSYTDELAEIIDETLGKGGNVVIPSFAVGRTQELLYFIREIKDQSSSSRRRTSPCTSTRPLPRRRRLCSAATCTAILMSRRSSL